MSVKSEGYRRIDSLSQAKRPPPEFQEDRRSVYWVDNLPLIPQNDGMTTRFVTTSRLDALAHPNVGRHADFFKGSSYTHSIEPHSYGRGPISPVSQSALKARCTPRLGQLGQPKSIHSDYFYDRTAYMMVTRGAQSAEPTERLVQLSQPLPRKQIEEYREIHWGQTFPVSDLSKKALATGRVEQLAEAKGYHKSFRDEKPVQWNVPDGALKATANVRLQQLSRPRSRTMIRDDFDPYKVSYAARRVHATPRVEELCVPIPRKVRAKKV